MLVSPLSSQSSEGVHPGARRQGREGADTGPNKGLSLGHGRLTVGHQKGFILVPVARGEKGQTRAHMRASLWDTVD